MKSKKEKTPSSLLSGLKASLEWLGFPLSSNLTHPATRLPLSHLTPDETNRVYARLTRLYGVFRQQYRTGGNMQVPEPLSIEKDVIAVRMDRAISSEISLDEAASSLSADEKDILIRTLLAQLIQLKSLGYLHGSLSPGDLPICRRGAHFAFALRGLERGRFLDEPAARENQAQTPWPSPEFWRWMKYAPNGVPAPSDDMFAAGCVYHQLLTGRPPHSLPNLSAGAGIARGTPLSLRVPEGPKAELIRWMLSPNPSERPTPEEAMDALNAPDAEDAQPSGQRLLPLENGRFVLSRRLSWLWEKSSEDAQTPLFARQAAFRARETTRLTLLEQTAREWSDAQTGIAPCRIQCDAKGISVCSVLPEGPLLTLGQLCRLYDSSFLLDARMVDLLLIANTLHDSGWILGLISEDRFCVQATPSGGQAWMVDFSSAMPLCNLPAPGDIRADDAAKALLSPELAQYMVSASNDERETAEGWIGPASDIFALGLMYHLILTGRLPALQDGSGGSFADAVCFADNPQRAIALDPGLDERHSRLIYEMLTANPLNRLASCGVIAGRILDFYTA